MYIKLRQRITEAPTQWSVYISQLGFNFIVILYIISRSPQKPPFFPTPTTKCEIHNRIVLVMGVIICPFFYMFMLVGMLLYIG